MALFVWCSLSLLLPETETGPPQPSAILSLDFCSMADILKLVSIHFAIQMVPQGEILYRSLESVGESSGSLDLEHERTSCSILWDLGPPRKNPRTEKPLITASLPSVQHLQIQYPASQIMKTSVPNIVSTQSLCCDTDDLPQVPQLTCWVRPRHP